MWHLRKWKITLAMEVSLWHSTRHALREASLIPSTSKKGERQYNFIDSTGSPLITWKTLLEGDGFVQYIHDGYDFIAAYVSTLTKCMLQGLPFIEL